MLSARNPGSTRSTLRNAWINSPAAVSSTAASATSAVIRIFRLLRCLVDSDVRGPAPCKPARTSTREAFHAGHRPNNTADPIETARQKARKRKSGPDEEAGQPQFDHKTDRLSLLSGLLTDWFGEHIVDSGARAVSSGHDGRFASQRLGAAKGRQ